MQVITLATHDSHVSSRVQCRHPLECQGIILSVFVMRLHSANRLLVCMAIVAVPFDKRKSLNMYISFLNSLCVYAYMVLFARVVWGPTLAHHIIVVTSMCGGELLF